MRTFGFFSFIKSVEYNTICASSISQVLAAIPIKHIALNHLVQAFFLFAKSASFFFFFLPQLSQFYLKHDTAHVIWTFLLISLKAIFFWKRKKNAHNAQSFKQRSSVKTEKSVFIKNWDEEGQVARTSSALRVSHTRCKLLHKEKNFVTGGCSLVQAIMFTTHS